MLALANDPEAQRVSDRWCSTLQARESDYSRFPVPAWSAVEGNQIYRQLVADVSADAYVGTRVAIVGPEVDVMQLRAGFVDEGFIWGEITVHATSTEVIRLRCAHCGVISRQEARPADVVTCPGCHRLEVVHHNFSRRLAAFLGFQEVEHVATHS